MSSLRLDQVSRAEMCQPATGIRSMEPENGEERRQQTGPGSLGLDPL